MLLGKYHQNGRFSMTMLVYQSVLVGDFNPVERYALGISPAH